MRTDFLAECDRVAAAVLSGMGGGILLAAAIGLTLWALGRTNAATRHAAWLATLLVVAALIPAELWLQGLLPLPGTRGEGRASLGATAIPEGDRFEAALATVSTFRPDSLDSSSLAPVDTPAIEETGSSGAAREALPGWVRSALTWVARPARWDLEPGSVFPVRTSQFLLAVWAAVATTRLSLILWQLSGVRRIKRASNPAGPELESLFETLRQRLNVRRSVRLRVSPAPGTALALGYFHPVIVLPAEEGQPIDLEAAGQVLTHELGHIRRLDDWTNLAQRCLQAVLFFHPAVWWISKRLSLEREIACDDIVLQQGGRPQSYALLLVNLAGRRLAGQPLLAPGVSAGKYQLQQRMNMILNAHRNASPRLAKAKLGLVSTTAALLGMLALYAGPKLVLADGPPNSENAASARAESVGPSADDFDLAAPAPVVLAGLPEPPVPPALVSAGPEDDDSLPRLKGSPPQPGDARAAKAAAARLPRAPRTAASADKDSSIEQRLERLERMVESLISRQPAKAHPEVTIKPPRVTVDLDEIRIQAKKEAEMEAAIAKKEAVVIAKRALEKAVKSEEKARAMSALKLDVQKQLDQLLRERDGLQRQMERLQRQIERLERQRPDQEEHSHDADSDADSENRSESKSSARSAN